MFVKSTFKEQAYEYLLNLIVNNQLEPSKVYSERHFAEIMGISRTPVREAILQLQKEGYIVIQSNKGIKVKEISQNEMHEILQMRMAIEGFCALYAAENITSQEGQELCQSMRSFLDSEEEMLNKEGIQEEFIKNDLGFHLAIIDFCGNSRMKESIVNLRNQISRIGLQSFYKKDRIIQTHKEHLKIYEAIKSGNAKKAFLNIKEHLLSCEEILKGIK